MGLRPGTRAPRHDPLRDTRHTPLLDRRHALRRAVPRGEHQEVRTVFQVPPGVQGHRVLDTVGLRRERLLRDGEGYRGGHRRTDGTHRRIHERKEGQDVQVLQDHVQEHGQEPHERGGRRPAGRVEGQGGGFGRGGSMRGVYIYDVTCAFLGGVCRVSDLMTGVCGIFPRFSGLSRCIVLDTNVVCSSIHHAKPNVRSFLC